MVLNCPGGAVVCWWVSAPQHWAVPSVRSAHEWSSPTAMAVKLPAGGVDSPSKSLPQHWAVPSVRTAQVWATPAAMARNDGASS